MLFPHSFMDQRNPLLIQNLTILNWNANGLKQKRSTFVSFLARHNIDIACVTETHLVRTEQFKVNGYHVYREDRQAPIASGGVAIFVKKQITHHDIYLPGFLSIEATGIKVRLSNGGSLIILAAYKSPNKRFYDQDLQSLFYSDSPTLVLGDFNCKNRFWGCAVTNPNGNRLLQAAGDNNINISSPDEPTHYPPQFNFQPDILDIVLHKGVDPPIFQQVLPELDSDHVPVIVNFFLNPQFCRPPLRLINGKVDWDIFATELDKCLEPQSNLNTVIGIDNAVVEFTNCLKNCVQKATIPQRRPTFVNFNHPPLRILRLIKQKHNARRQWQRHRLPYLKRRLNTLTRLVKSELDNYRIESYQRYLSDIDPGDSSMWKATKRILRTQTIIPTLRENNLSYESDVQKTNLLADYFESAFQPNAEVDDDTAELVHDFMSSTSSSAELPIKFISPSEIKSIIHNLRLRKAPGADLIPNIVLKYLTPKSLAILASIFNACISRGHFPSSWKHAEIIVIHKPNKPKHSPSSYRPISLLSSISKVLEKLIQKRLLHYLELSNILPPCQFGFRPMHSTTHQILRLTEKIIQGFEGKKHSAAAFLDVAQAFDKVWHEGLLYKLYKFGFPKFLQNLISSFLDNRTFCVKLNSTTSTLRPIKAGVPQGSILGPLLFNIFMSDMPDPPESTLALYADDTAVITQSSDLDTAVDALQLSVDCLYDWFSKWRLALNPTKCEMKIFSLKKYVHPPGVFVQGNLVRWNPDDQAIKYLGVYLDRRLNWNFHVNNKLAQGYARLAQLYSMINRKSTLKPTCSILIYKTILRPLIMYACPVWGPSLSKSKLNKIQIFQNKILRIAVNSPWYIRNEHIHEELGIDNISMFIRKSTVNFLQALDQVPGAVTFNIGQPTQHLRLKRRLPQDIMN